jgi:phosphate transport system permease protein
MTDVSFSTPGTSFVRRDAADAAALVRKRYRSEARFRAYGAFALALTTVFVLAVLGDILMRGSPAFWQHSLVVDIPLKAEDIDPQGTKDPTVLRQADYMALSYRALRDAVPGVEGRLARKKLDSILSSGASNELRAQVVSNPSLVGSTVKTRLLLSDEADLYLKGHETALSRQPGRGTLVASDTKGEIKLLTSSNDFAEMLVAIKRTLADRIEGIKGQLRRAERSNDAALTEQFKAEIEALTKRANTPNTAEALDERMPSLLIAANGGLVKLQSIANAEATGVVILPMTSAAEVQPGSWSLVRFERPESNRKASDLEVAFLEKLRTEGKVQKHFNTLFFTSGDSREPELAGILGSLIGSILMLTVTIILCVPVGVLAAVYLEEFAPKNWFTDIIEININNLAAVPSIVFGLLGLAVFLNFFGLPRSAPIVGGLVLGLLVLPTIIIAARAALKAVPPSIKEAALGVGASHQQAIFHHVLPLAMPGIMTGTIIGMAHALGETAPLLMIGMLAFVVDIPKGFTDSATALPAQIYIWSDLPEQAFQAKTAAAIIVLLTVLFVMNGLAIWLRKRFERRW